MPIRFAKDNIYLPIPVKYLHVASDGKVRYSITAFAGYALELLWRKRPDLRDAMKEARTLFSGLERVKSILDEIHRGIYRALQLGGYTEDDFVNKLNMVISKFYGGLPSFIDGEREKLTEELKEVWNNILSPDRRKIF